MTTHCIPEADRSSSSTMLGAAMETIVWSMNVIDTANSIAARATVWLGGVDPTSAPPGAELPVLSLMVEV
ncbi:hypothetical protein GCM10010515_54720 [Streptomyces fructofermentans]|uniref:Uncharacterized protein n=1 Tax=Streptomyces fructofermentans TaxID=152141 RepID=A0A918NM16_9ACTN|nr:hypothetical protein GCM10010515_54720 [Streptomyces fructofermentans]